MTSPTVDPRLPRVPNTKSLLGNFDGCDHGYEVSGWVFDSARNDRFCQIQTRIDGKPFLQVEANLERSDLRHFGIRPTCGFRINLPANLFDGTIRSLELIVLPENIRLGAPYPIVGIIRDHKLYPKQFSVETILKIQDGAIDYDKIFHSEFLATHGVRAAIAYAYLWLLKRPVDRGGWDFYSEKILSNEMSLGDLLRNLSESEECLKAKQSGLDQVAEFKEVLRHASTTRP